MFREGTGEIADLARRFDWAATPLGAPECWPAAQQATVALVLAAASPMSSLWGPQRVAIYNEPYRRIIGAAHPAAFGRPIFASFPDLRDVLEPLYDRVFAGEALVRADAFSPFQDYGVVTDAGFDASFVPVRDGETVIGALTVLSETTAYRRERAAAGALATVERRLRDVADLVPCLLLEADAGGEVVWVNERWHAVTALRHDGVSSAGIQAIVHPDDLERVVAQQTIAVSTGGAGSFALRLRMADGAYRWHACSIEPQRDDRGIVRWIGAISDVHEQHGNLDIVRAHVAEARGEAAALRRRLLSVEQDERRRISRELHDNLGQQIVALGLTLRNLAAAPAGADELARRVAEIVPRVETLGRDLHAAATSLRPRELDEFGLGEALATHVEAWSARSAIAAGIVTRLDGADLSPAIELAVYRIVQEALSNVARHSGAQRAAVVLERRDADAVLIVEDDGCGFDPDGGIPGEGIGLRGIAERAAILGGALEIEARPGGGTTLYVRFPLDSAAAGVHA